VPEVKNPETRKYLAQLFLNGRVSLSQDPGDATGSQVVHNEEDHMGRTLHLGDALVDETTLVDLCRRYRVRELLVFGSAARGELRPNSDIDLLVEFLPDAEVDLIDHAGLMLDLAQLLGRKVDLVSKNGLKPLIRASVLQEARLLYAA
jgi:predicted nucleotidyltransferase